MQETSSFDSHGTVEQTSATSAYADLVKRYARESLDITRKLVDRFPGRLAGSSSCHETAAFLHKELEKHCDTATIEPFIFHPNAFLGFLKVMAVLYVVCTALTFLGGPWILLAAVGFSISLWWAITQFVYYHETFDFFYRKAEGYNVSGTIEPADEVTQQLIVAGHHDSAHVFTFFRSDWQKYYAFRIIAAVSFIIFACLVSWIWGLQTLLSGHETSYAVTIRYILLIGLTFVTPFYFFVSKRISPGAGDNLISTMIALKMGEHFGQAKKQGKPFLQHTRLIILSTDAEESGLRGARAYVRKHKSDLQAIPTYFYNLESIYSPDHIQFLISDLNGTVRLSEKMARECLDIATESGYAARLFPFTFGGGSTDSAEFAKIGIEATTLLGMPTEVMRESLTYHTRDDTVDNIDARAVEAAVDITLNYLLKKDRQA